MKTANDTIKDSILEAALPDVAFDGWTVAVLEKAAVRAGHSADMVKSVFPDGVESALCHFSRWADRKMIAVLPADGGNLRVREKIALAVRTRLEVLEPWKEAERLAVAWWMGPMRKVRAAKLVWKTADVIWIWAGDTATDYNRYTKRALLSGVLTSTLLCWLSDRSEGMAETRAFLDRRIDNVLSIGKIVGRFKKA